MDADYLFNELDQVLRDADLTEGSYGVHSKYGQINLSFGIEEGMNAVPNFFGAFDSFLKSGTDEEKMNSFLGMMNTFASSIQSKRYVCGLSFEGNIQKVILTGQIGTPASVVLRETINKFVLVQNRRVGEVNVIPQVELIEDIGKVVDPDETLLNSALSSFLSQEYNK